MSLNDMGFFTIRTKLLSLAFESWPMVRYKREVVFGWVDLLGKYINKSILKHTVDYISIQP
jgi:hypothetical protein